MCWIHPNHVIVDDNESDKEKEDNMSLPNLTKKNEHH